MVMIDRAVPEDVLALAYLLWLDTHGAEPEQEALKGFADDLAVWWSEHRESHRGFVARSPDGSVVGMAWVALVSRVPRPVSAMRRAGDLQTVYVLPEHRGHRIGSALVEAAATHAMELGASRVTVHSGRKAIEVYRRLGFAASPRLLQRPADDPASAGA
ncbi:MAG: putative N-acetyltransferase [Frankiales bacterium]|nr:putative N-acetyltransferase [Frankiales bacterium]